MVDKGGSGGKSRAAGNKCSLPHCGRSRRCHPDIKLFKFPDYDSPLYIKWAEVCSISEDVAENSANLYLCSRHFEESCLGKKFLRRGSVPTLCLRENDKSPERTVGRENFLEESNMLDMFKTPPCTSRKRKIFELSPSFACRLCEKTTKQREQYRKLWAHERRKGIMKEKDLENMRRKYKNLLKKMHRNRKLQAKEQEEENSKLNENERTLVKMFNKSRKSGVRWESEEIFLSQNLFYRSASSYLFLRNVLKLHLPSPSTINRWSTVKKLQPGNNECIFDALRKATEKMNDRDKTCVMLFDEVAIRHNLTYNSSMDVVDGLVDLGFRRENKIGGQICTFMLRGIFSNWKFILKYVVSEKGLNGEILRDIIKENVQIIDNIGLDLRAVTCDQGPSNRKAFDLLAGCVKDNITDTIYFEKGTKRIYLLYDVPHLIKSFRNAMLKGKFETPDGPATFDVVRELFEIESGKVTKMTNLTIEHIYPTPFDKMKIDFAAEVFSHTTSAAIKTCAEDSCFRKVDKETALSTAKFIEKINVLFDCLNSKNLDDPNPFKRGLKKGNRVWNTLVEMKEYIKSIKYNGHKIYCQNGMVQTINGILSLGQHLFEERGDIFFIHTSRFNQDPLENAFSTVRAKGGNCKNPSVHEFNIIVAKMLSLKLLHFSSKSNCLQDEDQTLEVDLQEIVQESHGISQKLQRINRNDIEDNITRPALSYQQIVKDNEEYFNDDFDCFTSEHVPIELMSTRYFVGYLAHRVKCEMCRIIIIKPEEILTCPSELFIHFKNYINGRDFGSLCAPSDIFFDVCRIQIKVFEKIFNENMEIRNIRKTMADESIRCVRESPQQSWFDEEHPCYSHRITIMNLLLTVMLRKHCTWTCRMRKSNKDKVQNLTHQ